MKKALVTTILTLSCFITTAQNTFQRSINSLYNTILIPTSDSGFLVVSSVELVSVGQFEVFIQKTDMNGNAQWTRAYGTANNERMYSGVEQNGFYYLCGTQITPSDTAGVVMKLNTGGNLIWTKSLTFASVFRDITATSDGNLGVTGTGNASAGSDGDMITYKIDTASNVIWGSSVPSSTTNDTAHAVIEYGVGGLLTVGTWYQNNQNHQGIYYANDAFGVMLFAKTYYNSMLIDAFSYGGDYYIGGMNLNVDDYLLLLKVAPNGDTLSTITFGNWFYLLNVKNIHPVQAGVVLTGNGSGNSPYAMMVDYSGNLVWSKIIAETVSTSERCNNSVISASGRIALGGSLMTSSGSEDAWMISGSDFGNFGCNTTDNPAGWWHVNEPHMFVSLINTLTVIAGEVTVQLPLLSCAVTDNVICTSTDVTESTETEPLVYPCPATERVTIQSAEIISKAEIISINGDVLIAQTGASTATMEINLSRLSPGIYLIRTTSISDRIQTVRLIKE